MLQKLKESFLCNPSMKTLTTPYIKYSGHAGPLYTIAHADKENFIFSGGSDKTIAKWNLDVSEPENFSIKLQHTIYSILYTKASHQLWIGQSQGGIHVVDLENKKEIKWLQSHSKGVFDLLYNSNNHTVISCSADGTLAIWDAENFSLLSLFHLTKEKVRKASLYLENNLLAVALGNGDICLMDMTNYKEVHSFHAHNLSANVVVFHPSFPLLISGGRDAHLNIWDIQNNYKKVDSIPAHNYAIYDIAFHPSFPLFATASRDKSIKLWNAENGTFLEKIERKTHQAHTHSINKLLWVKFKDLLISTGDDSAIISWNTQIINQ